MSYDFESFRRATMLGWSPVVGEESYRWDLVLGTLEDGRAFGISLRDLPRHLLVLGTVGSGKTSFAMNLGLAASGRGVSVVVLDWEGEYVGLAERLGAEVARAGMGDGVPLFRVDGVEDWRSYSQWLSWMIVALLQEEARGTTPQMEYVLSMTIQRAVEERCSLDCFDAMLLRRAQGLPGGGQTYTALRSRLSPLIDGPMRRFVEPQRPIEIGSPLVLDLSLLSRANPWSAAFAARLYLGRLFFRRRATGRGSGPRVLVIIEEAEEVFPRRSTIIVDLLARMLMRYRKRGIGVALVAHGPSLLDYTALQVPASAAVFHLQSSRDAAEAARLLSEVEPQAIQALGPGELFLRPASARRTYRLQALPPPIKHYTGKTTDADRLLQNIVEHPFLTHTERRQLLGMNGKRYYNAVRELIARGVAREITIYTGRGKPARILVPQNIQEPAHTFVQMRVAEAIENILGVKPRINRKGPDITFTHNNQKICIEIETGTNTHPLKYKRYQQQCQKLIIICTWKNCQKRLTKQLALAGYTQQNSKTCTLRQLPNCISAAHRPTPKTPEEKLPHPPAKGHSRPTQ